MRLLLILVFCCAPAMVAAQQADPRDVAAVQGCVDSQSRGTPQAHVIGTCVGIISNSCGDQTTLGISECIMREHAAWDRLLNDWWKPMRARAKADGSWPQLLARQRQWIADRDAECAAAYDSAGGGSIRVIYAAECQRDLTARKAVEFYYSLYK